MHANVRRGHDALWRRFFNEQTNLVYDIHFRDASWFPTSQEVNSEIPSCAGWGTGMEDCCLDAGLIIDGMVRAHRMTGETEWAEKARKLFTGLVRLGTISGLPGYISRGFAPGRADVYPNSSTDQYTTFVYGMWSYYHSGIATIQEQMTVEGLLVDVARLVESFHDDIPRLDMRASIYGDSSAMTADRACRLLEFYKAAYDVSGDKHWQRVYLDKVQANGGARLKLHYGPERWPADRNTHAVIQNQVALHLLYMAEEDPALKAEYEQGLKQTAQCVLYRIPRWREIVKQPAGRFLGPGWRKRLAAFRAEHPDYDPSKQEDVRQWHMYGNAKVDSPSEEELGKGEATLPWLRHQVESLAVAMLCEDGAQRQEAGQEGWPMLAEADWTLVGDARVWASLDLAYWRGVEAGVFPVR